MKGSRVKHFLISRAMENEILLSTPSVAAGRIGKNILKREKYAFFFMMTRSVGGRGGEISTWLVIITLYVMVVMMLRFDAF